MRILVTGGSGFMGTNLVSKLLSAGHELCNADVVSPRNSQLSHYWKSINILNIGSIKDLLNAFQPKCIIHMAARTDLNSNEITEYSANIEGVQNIVTASNEVGTVERIIFFSSRLVCKIGYSPFSYEDYCPTTAYGQSKVIGEQIVKKSQDNSFIWTIVRPTSIWGPWFGVPYRIFFDKVRSSQYCHPRGCSIYKSFGFVGNSNFQICKLLEAPSDLVSNKTFYLGDYFPIEVSNFASLIAREFGNKKVLSAPANVLKFVAMCGDLVQKIGYKNPPLTTFRLNNLMTDMIHDFSDIAPITGPLPYSIEQGVVETVQWMKSHK